MYSSKKSNNKDQSQAGNSSHQSSSGYGINSSASGSGPQSQVYDDQRSQSRSISRANTNADGSQRSLRPQSSTRRNVGSSQGQYPSQTGSSSSFRNQSSSGYGANSSRQPTQVYDEQRSRSISRLNSSADGSQRSVRPQSSIGRNGESSQGLSQAGNSSSFRNSSTGYGTNSSASGPQSQVYDDQRSQSRSISRLNTNADGSQRSLRPQSSTRGNGESSQAQYPSQTGSSSSFRNQSSTGYGTNSSTSRQPTQVYDDQRSGSVSRGNTTGDVNSQRSLRPQSSSRSNVGSSQGQYPSQTRTSSSIRYPTNSSASIQDSDYDRNSQRISSVDRRSQRSQHPQSMGRNGESESFVPNSEYSSRQISQPVSNSAYASRGGESTNGRSGAYENGPSTSNADYSQNVQPRTRREVQKSYLEQQRERQQQGRNLSNQVNQPSGSTGHPGNYPYAQNELIEEKHSEYRHCQQEQRQCQRVSAFTVRSRQVYCIPRNPALIPNQNCHRFKIVPEPSPCELDRCYYSWSHICVCPIRFLIFTLLLLLCFLLFFASIYLFGVLLARWEAYKSKYCSGPDCKHHDPHSL